MANRAEALWSDDLTIIRPIVLAAATAVIRSYDRNKRKRLAFGVDDVGEIAERLNEHPALAGKYSREFRLAGVKDELRLAGYAVAKAEGLT